MHCSIFDPPPPHTHSLTHSLSLSLPPSLPPSLSLSLSLSLSDITNTRYPLLLLSKCANREYNLLTWLSETRETEIREDIQWLVNVINSTCTVVTLSTQPVGCFIEWPISYTVYFQQGGRVPLASYLPVRYIHYLLVLDLVANVQRTYIQFLHVSGGNHLHSERYSHSPLLSQLSRLTVALDLTDHRAMR